MLRATRRPATTPRRWRCRITVVDSIALALRWQPSETGWPRWSLCRMTTPCGLVLLSAVRCTLSLSLSLNQLRFRRSCSRKMRCSSDTTTCWTVFLHRWVVVRVHLRGIWILSALAVVLVLTTPVTTGVSVLCLEDLVSAHGSIVILSVVVAVVHVAKKKKMVVALEEMLVLLLLLLTQKKRKMVAVALLLLLLPLMVELPAAAAATTALLVQLLLAAAPPSSRKPSRASAASASRPSRASCVADCVLVVATVAASSGCSARLRVLCRRAITTWRRS
jgi:hypothetical protein